MCRLHFSVVVDHQHSPVWFAPVHDVFAYCCCPFTLINKEGKITYVKFHWKPTCGVKNLLEEEAVTVGGSNHSHATKVSLVLGFT